MGVSVRRPALAACIFAGYLVVRRHVPALFGAAPLVGGVLASGPFWPVSMTMTLLPIVVAQGVWDPLRPTSIVLVAMQAFLFYRMRLWATQYGGAKKNRQP